MNSSPRCGLFFYPARLWAMVFLGTAVLATVPIWYWALIARMRGHFGAFFGYDALLLALVTIAAAACLSIRIRPSEKQSSWLLRRSCSDDLMRSKTEIASAESEHFWIYPPQLVGLKMYWACVAVPLVFISLYSAASLAFHGSNPHQMIGVRFTVYVFCALLLLYAVLFLAGNGRFIRNLVSEPLCAIEVDPDDLVVRRYTRRTNFDCPRIIARVIECNQRELIVVLDDHSRSIAFGIEREQWKNLREHLHYAKVRANKLSRSGD